MDTFGWILEQVLRPVERKDFTPLPKRWVVERTFGWFYWYRRLSRDDECSTHSAECLDLSSFYSPFTQAFSL